MMNPIIKEYKKLLKRKQALELELFNLAQGYISQKTIKGKSYSYLQQRVSGKMTGRYLKSTEVAQVNEQIGLRKQYDAEHAQIIIRLSELEQAACLIDCQMSRGLQRLKISVGMDDIDSAQKEKSFAFANAMNAIENIPISETAVQEMAQWQDGSKSFLSVFEDTLKRYGFPVGLR